MTEILEQKLTVELPTLLIDHRGSQVTTGHPGLEQFGYLGVPGTMDFGVTLRCPDDDPSQVSLTLRVLAARYEPPAGCSARALEIVNQVNHALIQHLTAQ